MASKFPSRVNILGVCLNTPPIMHLRPQKVFLQPLWYSHTPVAGICAIDLCDAEGEEKICNKRFHEIEERNIGI